MTHSLHWPHHQKIVIKTILLQCESSGLVKFLSFMYPIGCNSYLSNLLSVHVELTVHLLCMMVVIFLTPVIFYIQKKNILPFNPYVMKDCFIFFQRKFLSPSNYWMMSSEKTLEMYSSRIFADVRWIQDSIQLSWNTFSMLYISRYYLSF